MITLKTLTKGLVATAAISIAPIASAMPMVFFGADQAAATANSDQAFASWETAVGNYTLDNLDGLAGTPGFGGSLTSALGNTFTSSNDLVGSQNFSFAVLQDVSLRLTRVGSLTDFVWDIADSVDSFGFFSRNNDGGQITIALLDGTIQFFNFNAANGNSRGDNFFWGISGLEGLVSTISIASTDPGSYSTGGNSNWDRFVYGTPVIEPPVAVPAPGGLGLLLLAGLGIVAARRKTA